MMTAVADHVRTAFYWVALVVAVSSVWVVGQANAVDPKLPPEYTRPIVNSPATRPAVDPDDDRDPDVTVSVDQVLLEHH